MDYSSTRHSPKTPTRRNPSPNTVLAVLAVGTFLAPLDSSIVNIALPYIAQDLKVSLTAVSWVATAYLLTSAALLLSMGRVGDMWGLRNLYVWGLLIFGAGSAACALSHTLPLLLGARVLQAVGAAMLFAAGPAIVVRTFPPQKRGAALGIVSLAVAAGLTVGPALGGVLVGTFGWQSIFIINIPLSVVAAAIAWFILSEEPPVGERFDMLGAVLAAGALLSLLGAVTEVETYGIASIEIIGALLATVFLGVSFVWWERQVTHPMVDLRLFRSQAFSAGLGAAVLAYMAMFSVIFTMPFYLLGAKGLPATFAGILLTATPLAMAALAPFVGRLTDTIGSRLLSTVGLVVLAVGLVVISALHANSAPWFIGLALFIVGCGMAIFQTPNTAAVMRATPRARAGVGSAFVAEARNIGMMLGIALTAAIVTLRMGGSAGALEATGLLEPGVAAMLIAGMSFAMRVSAGLALIGAALSWFFRDDTASKVEHERQGG